MKSLCVMSLSRMKPTMRRCAWTEPSGEFLAAGNNLLHNRTQGLGLSFRGDDAFSGDHRSDEVAHHGLLVSGVTTETVTALWGTAHD